MESHAFTRAKSHVKSKLKGVVLNQCSHYLIPGHIKNNLNQMQDENFSALLNSEMFQEYPYNCDLPKPLLPPSKIKRDNKEDPSLQLLHIKAKIEDDVDRYLKFGKKNFKSLDKNDKNNSKLTEEIKKDKITLPNYVQKTAEILECDPDPDFNGSYNWYYSGGTLNGIFYGDRNILVFPYMDELIAIPIHLKEDFSFKPDYKNAAKISMSGNPFQIVCSVSDQSGRILTRFKNECFLYKIFNLEEKKLQLLKIKNQSSDKPYVSVDLDPWKSENYCTVDVNRVIKIWSTKQKSHLLTGKVLSNNYLEDNWAFIKYDECEDNILKFIDRHCVHYFDTRLPIEKATLKMCPTDVYEDCESISSYIASCKSEYYSYVGSNHSLCLLDRRAPGNNVIKKWSHQFKSSPLFTDACFRENNEFVIIASQLAGETAVVFNNWISNENTPQSISLPFTPPSMVETLSESQSQGNCLNPHLKNRLSMCNTGCMTTVDQHEIFLLTQNSLNDIFYQGIGYLETLNCNSLENVLSLQKLKKWNKQILKRNCDIVSPLVVTKKASAREIFRKFLEKDQADSLRIEENEKNEEDEFNSAWQRSIGELNEFVDLFAPELLTPWEIVEDTPQVPVTAEPHQKVLSWLGMAPENQGPSTSNNPSQPPNNKNEEVNPDQNLNAAEFDDESIQQLFLPKVKTNISNKKKNAPRSKYVPGF